MLKKSLRFSIIFFTVTTIWQWGFESAISWGENIASACASFFIYFLVELSAKDYDRQIKSENNEL
ncbi:hypothetical protein AAV35_010895 [Salimicrobium jeotgali]|uniref:Uncharacterized protein n=1 Tax=Salimicrobium jeotgali TaxID=1230341 RepID=K2H9M9_9BACI|nr:hypothetical protein [Salimicrobium jeotgali]AKG05240.1 hypothetical protein AAV35_010895 [Salimicrobium jeotgali]EKE32375.1 hypothetical protein MJ3_03022 [Salimicrobium jeotgali]MBM7695648.1 hypothetical protein [Salimicrobium jeotgali]